MGFPAHQPLSTLWGRAFHAYESAYAHAMLSPDSSPAGAGPACAAARRHALRRAGPARISCCLDGRPDRAGRLALGTRVRRAIRSVPRWIPGVPRVSRPARAGARHRRDPGVPRRSPGRAIRPGLAAPRQWIDRQPVADAPRRDAGRRILPGRPMVPRPRVIPALARAGPGDPPLAVAGGIPGYPDAG